MVNAPADATFMTMIVLLILKSVITGLVFIILTGLFHLVFYTLQALR